MIHVVEHATTDLVIDTGPTGDSSGDLLTFANDLYDETNVDKAGHDQGDCIRINTAEGTWECRWINFLKGGAITVEGPFFDSHDSVLVITGGRGTYKGARGSMELKVLPDGSGPTSSSISSRSPAGGSVSGRPAFVPDSSTSFEGGGHEKVRAVAAISAVVVSSPGWWRRLRAGITPTGHHGARDRARHDGQGDRHGEAG